MRFNKDGFVHFDFNDYLYWQITHEKGKEIMHKYRNLEILHDAGVHLKFALDIRELGLDKIRPMKLKIEVNKTDKWCRTEREWVVAKMPPEFLGRPDMIVDEFGWILPEK